MRNSILTFFILSTSYIYSQNSEYKSAIELIKSSSQFIEYSNQLSPKNSKLKIVETLFPLCAYCSWFKDFVECCEVKENIIDMFPEMPKIDLLALNDKGNKKFNIYLTDIKNSYFIAEVMYHKESNENLIYLFKVDNNIVNIVGFAKNVPKK